MAADPPDKPALTKNRPTMWHRHFASLVARCAPPDIEVVREPQFQSVPDRADLLLLRRHPGHARDREATVLRGLWPHIERAAVLEFKSPSRQFRRNDLLHLVLYGQLYHCEERDRRATGKPFLVHRLADLLLVLVVPAINLALRAELAEMCWQIEPLSRGYVRVVGPVHATLLVLVDDVCEAEKDEYLRLFSTLPVRDRAALYWLRQRAREWTTMDIDTIDTIEGDDEIFAKLLEGLPARLRLAGLSADERLVGLSADERLVGLSADERLAGLPADAVLEHFGPDAVLEHFGPDALARAIRALPRDIRQKLLEELSAAD